MDLEGTLKQTKELLQEAEGLLQSLVRARDTVSGREKQTQLNVVNKAVRQLEQNGLPVPNNLRSVKTDLVYELHQRELAEKGLVELANLLTGLRRQCAAKPSARPAKRTQGRARAACSTAAGTRATPRAVFRSLITEILREHNGSARSSAIRQRIAERLKGELTPRELESHHGQCPVWWNRAMWERLRMVKAGILRNDSPRGVWELVDR